MAVLKKNTKGKLVVDLQVALNKSISAKLEPDGKFGKLTEAAVKKFQKKKSLKPDGVAGPSTLAVLGIGPKPKVGKMKVEDCKKLRAYYNSKDSLDGVSSPRKFASELVEIKKGIRDIEGKFQSIVNEAERIQKEVVRQHAKIPPVLDQLVKLQAEYAANSKSDPVRASKTLVEIESLYGHFQKLEKLMWASQTKQTDLFLGPFSKLMDKTFM